MRLYINLEKNKQGDFGIGMGDPCYLCGNPTQLIIKVAAPWSFLCQYMKMVPCTDEFPLTFMIWFSQKRFVFHNNRKMMKRFGLGRDLKFRCVCRGCYECPPNLGKNIQNSEIGNRVPRTRSLNFKQVCAHFEEFNIFRSIINGPWLHPEDGVWTEDEGDADS